MKVGLNLYSLKEQIKGKAALTDTLWRLKETGYSYVQYSGAPFDAEAMKRASDETGMPIVLTHVPLSRLTGELDAVLAEHDVFGCKNVGLGAMWFPDVKEMDVPEKIRLLDELGAKIKAKGFTFCYHHHNFEFIRLSDGKTIFDHLISDTQNLCFTMDTFWMQAGGVNILETLSRVKGKAPCMHLQDYRLINEGNESGSGDLTHTIYPHYAPIGEGNINWQTVIAKLKEIGTEYFLVEQGDAFTYADPFAEVAKSARYLKENF